MVSRLKLVLNEDEEALIKNATLLWSQPSIKEAIKNSIIVNSQRIHQLPEKRIMKSLMRDLIDKIHETNFHDQMKSSLVRVVRVLGNRLFNWLKHLLIKFNSKKEIIYPWWNNYIDFLSWTNIGTIDVLKILDKIYENIEKEKVVNMTFIFEEACCYCHGHLVDKIWTDTGNEDKAVLALHTRTKIRTENRAFINVYNYWLWYLYDRESPKLCHVIDGNNQLSNALVMFISSVKSQNDPAMRYFYHFLSQEKKIKVLPSIVKWIFEAIDKHKSYFSLTEAQYYQRNFVGIFVFLWQELTEEMRQHFLYKYKTIILNLLCTEWVTSKFIFFDMLQLSLPYFTANDYRDFLDNVLRITTEQYEDFGNIQHIDFPLINKIWKKSPDHLRKLMITFSWQLPENKIVKLEKICFLLTAIGDKPTLPIYREICKLFGMASFDLITQEKYVILNLFIKNILQSEIDRICFIKQIDIEKVFRHFMFHKSLDDYDNFLRWRFVTNDNINLIKEKFKKSEFCISIIIDICCFTSKRRGLLTERLESFFYYFKFSQNDLITLKLQLTCENAKKKLEESCPKYSIDELWQVLDNYLQIQIELFSL